MRIDEAHTVTVGDLAVTPVSDGTLAAKLETIQRLDPVIARHLIDEAAHETGTNPLILPVRAFLVRSPGRLALIDTGSGTHKGPTMGHLPASLEALGVDAGEIDSILLTHLHMDHIGGLLDKSGRPAFANAELVLHRAEAEYFLDTPESQIDARSARGLEFVRTAVAAYGTRVRRVSDGEGLPGVSARLAPGHTPGHTVWQVRSNGACLVVLGDVVHLGAVQLPLPPTPMIYDVDPDLAGRTRIALLEEIARQGWLVAGAHLPVHGLGRIERKGEGYRFVPANSA